MASISKRKYWADPATGKEVKKGTPGAELRESRFYRIRYVNRFGNTQSVKGYTDARATLQLAGRLEAAAARQEEGLVNPFARHDVRPLSEHLADYLTDREMHGRDDVYRYVTELRVTKLMKECGWTRLRDVTAESFNKWRLSRVGKAGSSGKTLNQYLAAARGFMNWCAAKEQARVAVNPLSGLQPVPHTPTFQRKALSAEDLEALYLAAPVQRRRVYAFAVTTGLRRQECEDLRWGDVALDAPQPFLKLRAVATKARRADVFAIKSEIAAMLREFRPEHWRENDLVFVEGVPTVEQLLGDLAAAGVELPVEGEIDRIDFHALRTTLGSFLGGSDVSERTGMELMRVTDAKLLRQTYCDPRILQTARATQRLAIPTPSPSASSPGSYRTKQVVAGLRGLVADGGRIGTVMSDKGLSLMNSDAGVSLVGVGTGEGRDLGGVGPESSASANSATPAADKDSSSFTAKSATPSAWTFDPAGQLPDKGRAAGVRPDVLLTSLADLWPRLPAAVRTSIVSLARAAADPGGQSTAGAG